MVPACPALALVTLITSPCYHLRLRCWAQLCAGLCLLSAVSQLLFDVHQLIIVPGLTTHYMYIILETKYNN